MRSFNPMKKFFIYGLDQGAIAAGARATGRTAISSDSWFELHAIGAMSTMTVRDALYFNLYDDGVGRSLFSEPIGFLTAVPEWSLLGARALGGAADTYSPLVHRPHYLSTPYLFRPGSVLRSEFENRDGALVVTTIRLYFYGRKVYDLSSRDQSPGAVFAPFTYVADFGSVADGAIESVTVPIQSDSDFDIVSITTNPATFNAAVNAGDLFLTLNDLSTGFAMSDRDVSLTNLAGTPVSPFFLTHPYRMLAAGGLEAKVQNTTGGALSNVQVAFNGYKIFR